MDQLFKFVNNLNSAQRAVIMGGVSLLFVLLIALLIYSNLKAEDKKLNYTIASNLTKNQVMLASDELEASGIEFAVIGSGNSLTLKTSKNFINIAKIKLVTSEASTSKHVGWEIFEKSSLGTTNFENKVKYLRALEGELSRTLESLNGVIRASVKIAIPKDSIFTERKAETTASAVLNLKPGVFLTQKQINGIKNFISSAVSNLKTESISLIDQDGAMLEKSKDDQENRSLNIQNKYKIGLEEDYEKKIVDLLEPFVGSGRVVARVNIKLNFSKQNIQEEIYEPEGTIRSQQTTENISSSEGKTAGGGGIAGVENNIEDKDAKNNDGSSKSSNEASKNITNFEISKKVIAYTDNNFSKIEKISAAVTFDSSVLKDIQNKDEFISSLNSIVQDTIGYDLKRGDKVTVKDFKFLGLKDLGAGSNLALDEDGNPLVQGSNVDTLTMIKSILKDFSDYIQYIIAGILLLIFYKKFIVNNEIIILGDKVDGDKKSKADELLDAYNDDYGDGFDPDSEKGKLKAKMRNQIYSNLDGLDEERMIKYEVLIEELDKDISDNTEAVAKMIELLLNDGNKKLKR